MLTNATRETWTNADSAALLAEGGDLLTPLANNHKTRKQLERFRLYGRILHLEAAAAVSPYLGRDVTVCALAVHELCADPCLNYAGHGQMIRGSDPILHHVHRARIRRTLLYFKDRTQFLATISRELAAMEKTARRRGLKPIARLDGTSDLGLAERMARKFPGIMFWDYTKIPARMHRWLLDPPPNRHLTFSRGAHNQLAAIEILELGGHVAAVFKPSERGHLPRKFLGWPVSDGDRHDFRWRDRSGPRWIGLRAKGRAIHDRSGFVIW